MRNLLLFIAGGAALTYFLRTEKGKEIISNISETGNDLLEKAKDLAQQTGTKAKDYKDQTVNTARSAY